MPVGPAFEMGVLGEVACPPGSTATTCIHVRVVNRGDTTGAGSCRLRGHRLNEQAQEATVPGPKLVVEDLAPGVTMEATLEWDKPVPSEGFSGICVPGLGA